MKFKFYIDPETNAPHIYKHDVTEQEIIDVFNGQAFFERARNDGSYEAVARIQGPRYLRIAYRKNRDEYFVITAYDIEDKETIVLIEEKYENDR